MDELDYRALDFWWTVVNTLVMAAIALYVWATNRHKANSTAISGLDDKLSLRINEVEDRVITMEETLRHMPTRDDSEATQRRIDELAQIVKKLEGTTEQVNRGVDRIHDYLLNKE